MAPRQVSPTALLLLLSAAVFLTLVSVLMLGPLLVALAHEFQTSVAMVGSLPRWLAQSPIPMGGG
jgi:predicted MFS family arabinose efflux permease